MPRKLYGSKPALMEVRDFRTHPLSETERATRDAEIHSLQCREMALEVRAVAGSESDPYVKELSFSSPVGVRRWWGTEILDHSDSAEIDYGPFLEAGSFLAFHDPQQPCAKPSRAWLDKTTRRSRTVANFKKGNEGSEHALKQIDDEMWRGVSFGYSIDAYRIEIDEDGEETLIATKWTVREVSFLTVAADTGVGIGRSIEQAPSSARGSVRANPRQETTAMFKLKNGREVSLAELDALRMQGDVELADGTTATRSIPASVLDYARQQVGAAPATEPAKPATRTAPVVEVETESDATHKRALMEKTGSDDPVEAKRQHDIRQIGTFARAAAPENTIPKGEEDLLILRKVTVDDAGKHFDELVGTARTAAGGTKNDDKTIVGRQGTTTVGEDRNRASFRLAAVDAILQRASVPVAKPHDRAGEFRHCTLRDILDISLEMTGQYSGLRGSSKEMRVRAALGSRNGPGHVFQGHEDLSVRGAAMGHSASDFPFILANVANKALQTGYELANVSYNSGWARIVNIEDFKTRSVNALSESPDLELVGDNGEYTEGKLNEKREQYALSTYGRLISITRQAIINDDLDAFTRIPQMMGAAARRRINRVLYSILKTNAALSDTVALFHADHNNVGTAAAPSVTTLAELKKLMRMQAGMQAADEAGSASLLNIEPSFILFGPSQEEVILQILHNSIQATQSSNTVSKWISSLTPVCEPELENTPDAATGDYFLSAKPTSIDTVELGLLNGIDAPYMEEQMGFEVDGMRFKVRVDVGAKAIDYRGLTVNRAS